MKIQNKRELQNIAINYLYDIKFGNFVNTCNTLQLTYFYVIIIFFLINSTTPA